MIGKTLFTKEKKEESQSSDYFPLGKVIFIKVPMIETFKNS